MNSSRIFRLATVAIILPLLGCDKTTAPVPEPGFRLVSVDGQPLPVLISTLADFEEVVETRVASAHLKLLPDSTFVNSVTLRHTSDKRGRLPDERVEITGWYVIENDSITACMQCSRDSNDQTATYWKVPYSSTGFTLRQLFSGGGLRDYRYEWR